jgi:pyridoxine kinase
VAPFVLSIQSSVAYGHVGNSAAVFPLQRLGLEVLAVPTVLFSNHTGYPSWRGRVLPAADIAEIVLGVEERGAFARCGAVLSGYLGSVELGRVVLDAAGRVKTANPAALYCCDPVMGDVGPGLFVRPDIPAFFLEEAMVRADITTPNRFELERLTGRRIASVGDAVAAARAVIAAGPRIVLVTSLDVRVGELSLLAVTAGEALIVTTPRLPIQISGAGDLTAALFLGHLLAGRGLAAALARTASAVFAVIEATIAAGERELALVAAQDVLVASEVRFAPVDAA